MHEWALAEGVIATARKLSDEQGFRQVTKLVVRVGELQRISPDFFRKALDAVIPEEDPRLASVCLELQQERAAFLCRRCGRTFSIDEAGGEPDADALEAIHFVPELAHGFMSCPDCESPDFEVSEGRGVWLERVEGLR